MLKWKDKQNGVDDVLAEDINDIAHAVIDLQGNDKNNTVDQTYNPESENAQSGKAVAESILKNVDTYHTVSGKSLTITDVNPLQHELKVKLRNKNLIPFPYITQSGEINGVRFTVNKDGSIHVVGTATKATYFNLCQVDFGDVYMDDATQNYDNGKSYNNGYAIKDCQYNANNKFTYVGVGSGKTVDTTFYPQIEIAPAPTEYMSPNFDFSTVSVSKYGKNLFDFEAFANEIVEKNPNHCSIVYVDENGNETLDTNARRCLKYVTGNTGVTKDITHLNVFGFRFDVFAKNTSSAFFIMRTITTSDIYISPIESWGVTTNKWSTIKWYTIYSDKQITKFGTSWASNSKDTPIYIDIDSFMMEQSGTPTDYEPYKGQIIKANSDGTVKGLVSTPSDMWIFSDNPDVTIECSYSTELKTCIDNRVRELSNDSINFKDYNLPILYLNGSTEGMNKDDYVTLDYVYEGRVGTCEVKWQGSSSLSYAKKNYTIKFDNKFEAVEGWGTEKKYCLKANFIDHSHARNLINAKLWGQIVKSRANVDNRLNNLPNGGAVDGFPCIIALNGEFLGLYTFNIPKDGWMFGMSDETLQQAILCADSQNSACVFKALATLQDSNGDGSTDDFDVEYVSNEDDDSWLLPSLNNLISAVMNSDGTDLDTTVAQYLDWDSAIDYYIFCALVGGTDMVAKNYLLATYDGVKWFFSAYDMDSTHGMWWNGKSFFRPNESPTINANGHRVMELIRTYKKDELKARYEALRANVMSEANLFLEFTNWGAKLPTPILVEDAKKWSVPSSNASNTAQILNWYRMRVAFIDKQIENLK